MKRSALASRAMRTRSSRADERIAAARHDHAIAPVCPRGVRRRCSREAEDDLLLEGAADGDRARIDAAVAGIDARRGDAGRVRAGAAEPVAVTSAAASPVSAALRKAWRSARMSSMRRSAEAAARSRRHVDPRHEGRLGELDDDAGSARREQAVAEGRNQTCSLPGRFGRQVERHLRQVDDDPVGALHGRDASGDLAATR